MGFSTLAASSCIREFVFQSLEGIFGFFNTNASGIAVGSSGFNP
ncbi:hypothetical protein CKA32_000687 [Geitlerinema sp. FC II]|nr:hypothetical protein CKA32_000687 [Geitlerinema sp. FC II]